MVIETKTGKQRMKEEAEQGTKQEMERGTKQEPRRKTGWIFTAIMLLVVLTGAITFLYLRYLDEKNGDETAEDPKQTKQMENAKPDENADENYLEDALAINSRTVAWINIPDTDIDFPIVQADDNSYYLDHGFDGTEYGRGCPFLDYRCSSDFSDFNSIIYGHNIKSTYVFGPLLEFQTQDYFDSHSTGTLILPDEICEIHFIACAVVESDSFIYSVVSPTEDERLLYLKNILENAVSGTDFVPEELVDSRIVILSTCSYEFDNARTVLIGYIGEE